MTEAPPRTSGLVRRWRSESSLTQPDQLTRRPPGEAPPLSYAQERMWFLEQYVPGTSAYNMWLAFRLHGPLDLTALEAALTALVARHESLRMRFVTTSDGDPVVEVDPPGPVRWTVLDVTGAEDPVAAAQAAVRPLAAAPFDLATGPLLRPLLVRLGPDDHAVCLVVHHIVCDGWSAELMRDQLLADYETARAGRPIDQPSHPLDYGDYARWQREQFDRGRFETGLAYWRRKLTGVPALQLPTDRPYPPAQTVNGAGHTFRIDAELCQAVERLGLANRATSFMTFLAAYQTLLSWWCDQDDFGVGVPVSGRDVPETESMVGLFVNTLVFRTDLSGDPTFRELLVRVRQEAVEAYAHQQVPFERVVGELPLDRDVRRPPVFQVSFALQNYIPDRSRDDPGPGSLTVGSFGFDTPVTRHELVLYLYPEGDGLLGLVNYNTDLFDEATIAALFERYVALLRQVVADPDIRLSAVDLLTDEEHATLRRFGDGDQGGDDTAVPSTWRLLTDPFDEWVARTPDAPAVVCDGRHLSYRELADRADALARRLRGLGVGPDRRVGICLDQSTDLAVAMLGVLKAGGAYLPLDPEQPPARLAFLLDDASADVVITAPELTGRLSGYRGHVVTDLAGDDDPGGSSEPMAPVPVGPDHLAYVIYTSGSTGTPKGVAVQHRQLVNYLAGVRARLEIVDGARFALAQSLAFDFAVTMFYLALATGGCVHLIPRRSDGRQVAEYLAAAQIDYLKITPSHLAALALEVPERDLLPRRALIFGGEASRADWTRRLAGLSPARVINHYGPTEATVGVTTYEVDPDRDPGTVTTPIGRPLPFARVQVRDRAGRLVPVGAVGEIYLGGDRLAREYLGRPELTAEKFVVDPAGQRWYRTGDLARWLPGGDLEFLGRRDNQVKLRGYRIELGEVEAALAGLPEVAMAVVTVHNQTLCAYLEPTEPTVRPGLAQLRERLAQTLPEYMLPARAIWLDRLPLMAHGKVDRSALPDPSADRPDQAVAYAPPEGPVQEAIAAVWRTVLQVDQVGADDDFFELGGHSLLAAQVVSRLRRSLPETARPVTLMDIFKHRTVRALAAVAEAADAPAEGMLHELTRPPASGQRRLSLVCVPYGGASAVVYQPLADALPDGVSLYAVAVPGHDLSEADPAGAATASPVSLPEVAAALAEEVLQKVSGPLVLYGHCGPGGALTVELARRLEAAGRKLEAVYLGGIFPFARPSGPVGRLAKRLRLERLRSDTVYANWLQSLGADLGSLDPAERRHLIRTMRQDAQNAEDYFTDLFSQQVVPLRAPIISVVGERDPGTEYYAERYREWDFLSPRTALVIIDEAGHYFLKYRAEELATILTTVHPALATDSVDRLHRAGRPEATWWLHDPGDAATARTGPPPSLGRFLTVAAGQMVSMTGTALTEFALPIWAYIDTGSLLRFALFSVAGLLPGILVAPVAGALVDRSDRRAALIGSNVAAAVLLGLIAVLVAGGGLNSPLLYATLAVLSAVLSVQRLAYMSAVPQLVPKRYLGHANGVLQFGTGTAQFLTPLLAVALLEAVGLDGVLAVALGSYVVSLAILLVVRFPQTMAWRRRETVLAEIRNGYQYFFQRPGLRAMLMFFVTLNAPLAAVMVMLSPLVLSVGTLSNAGQVSMVTAGGAIAGGLLMAFWGGPRQRRMRGMLWTAAWLAVFAVVIGARPSLPVIAAGAFGFSFALTIVNGIWLTIIHTKVPQRFHARVIALNQMFALSVVCLGFILAPLAGRAFEPLMAPDGPLADSVGALIGVGAGRGIALLDLLCGLCLALAVAIALGRPVLANFDRDVPDAEPDDLVGLAALRARAAATDARSPAARR